MKPLLLIDCNDSFTYNIRESFRKLGHEIAIVPADGFDLDSPAQYSGLILSPGPGVPDEYPVIFEVIKRWCGSVPILGICLGHQIICSCFGGRLMNLGNVVHGQPRRISITDAGGIFRGLPGKFSVGLYHSWAVAGIPDCMHVSAVSDDGIIMGAEHDEYPVYGIQFHPESFISEYGLNILSNFTEICGKPQ